MFKHLSHSLSLSALSVLEEKNTYIILLPIRACMVDVRVMLQELGYIGHNRLLIWFIHINIWSNQKQIWIGLLAFFIF